MPALETIAAKVLEVALEEAIRGLFTTLLSSESKSNHESSRAKDLISFDATPASVALSISSHLEHVRQWSSMTSIDGSSYRKLTARVYVELDTYLEPVQERVLHESFAWERPNVPSRKEEKTAPLFSILQNYHEHIVLLGRPGAGKTTSVQKICDDYFVKKKALLNYNLPLLIELRSLPTDKHPRLGPLLSHIARVLGIRINEKSAYISAWADESITEAIQSALLTYLEGLQIVILLDGFDEIANPAEQRLVLNEVSLLCRTLRRSKIVLTSRSADFRFSIQGASKFEIASLTPRQIESFAHRWFDSAATAEQFLSRIRESPYFDSAVLPLTLSQLCIIYDRDDDIPEKPKSVYKKIVYLLLEDWDVSRRVKRRSRYAHFQTDRKVEFLAHLSFLLTAEHQKIRFDSRTLERIYSEIHEAFELPRDESKLVANEIESHSGLLIESGNRVYEFSHKSLQEFLTAEYLIRLHNVDTHFTILERLPNELAISTALSSNPTLYFLSLLLQTWNIRNYSNEFFSAFTERLSTERPSILRSPLVTVAAIMILEKSRLTDASTKYLVHLTGPTVTSDLEIYFAPTTTGYRLVKEERGYMLPKALHLTEEVRHVLGLAQCRVDG